MCALQKPWSSSYESETKKDDTYPHIKFAVLPALAVALVFNESPGILSLFSRPFSWAFEVAWAFSIFLEAIAFFPQLTLMYTQEKVEGITSHYLASLGAYRGLYLANWVWRYATESNYWAPIPWVAGIIQTGFYIDFLRVYFKHFRLEDLSLNKMNTYLPLSK
jgi:ER lumen protein retaining receptor